jgi:hypothetical protein
MRQTLRGLAIAVALAFVLATGWAVTVTGIFEPTRSDAPHYWTGAGNDLLLIRGGLAILLTPLLMLDALLRRGWRAKALFGLLALLVLPLFLWSCLGLERWAPGYSEAGFINIVRQHHTQRVVVTEQDVLAAIGSPLLTGVRETGEAVWFYSYMPSGGFGWHKRVLWLQDGVVTYTYAQDEP